MESMVNRGWVIKICSLSSKVFMPIMALTFILSNTVINLWIDERMETIQNVLAILILGIVACIVFSNPRENIPIWVRNNFLVVIYFIIRAVSLWANDLDYTVIRTIFFECFFLIGITAFTVNNNRNSLWYLKILLIIQVTLSACSLIVYYLTPVFNSSIIEFIGEFTYLDESGNALMFSNPNTAGIMAGFCIVLAVICYSEKIFNRTLCVGIIAFDIVALIAFGCRSADIAILVVMAFIIIERFLPKLKKKTLARLSLLMAVIIMAFVYVLLTISSATPFEFSSSEKKLTDISSNRYVVWTECYHSQQDNICFGHGSLKLEKIDRQEKISSLDSDYYANLDAEYYWRLVHATKGGPHNGYIAMLSCTGVLGLLLFLMIIWQRIGRAEGITSGKWYLLLVFIFIVNIFESLFIVNRFFTCFYLFILFTMGPDSYGNNTEHLLQEEKE